METASGLVEYGVLGIFATLMVGAICYLIKRTDRVQKDYDERSGALVKGFIDYLTEQDRRNSEMLGRMGHSLEQVMLTLTAINNRFEQHADKVKDEHGEIINSLRRIE